jgi:Glycogen recognition site of AMP-activated protein kinase/5'-AMP-activated protein kinase beta subunit, interaction domain
MGSPSITGDSLGGERRPITGTGPPGVGSPDRGGLSPPLSASSTASPGGLPSSTGAANAQLYQMYEPLNAPIPTVFRWEHGGNNVFITGAFNGWSRKVQMHRSGNDFLYIAALPRGRHAYKFIVDDEWRFAPDQPTVADSAGNINNLIDLTQYNNSENTSEDYGPNGRARSDTIPGVPWGQVLPDEDEYSKEPPFLPPHLRNIILNSGPPDGSVDPMQLQVPLHVTLKRLHCTAIKDGLMVQATTHRYRKKTVASVFYAVMPMSSSSAAQMAAAGLLPLPTAAAAPAAPLPVASATPSPYGVHGHQASPQFPGAAGPQGAAPPASTAMSPHLAALSIGAATGSHLTPLDQGAPSTTPHGPPPAVPASALPLVAASTASVGASATGAVELLAARVAEAQARTAQQQQQMMAQQQQQQMGGDGQVVEGSALEGQAGGAGGGQMMQTS